MKNIEVRDVVGFEGRYAVTSDGRIYSCRTGQFINPKLDKYGYYQIGLYGADKKQHWYLLHRLIAKAFLPNPDNLPDVAHKDENCKNNNLDNLQWTSKKDNNNMPLHKQRISEGKTGKKNAVKCIESGIVYKSCKDANNQTGISSYAISKCCRGLCETAGGYHWERMTV